MNLLTWRLLTYTNWKAKKFILAMWLAVFFCFLLVGCSVPTPSLTAPPANIPTTPVPLSSPTVTPAQITIAVTPTMPAALPSEIVPFQSLADFQQKLAGAVASGEVEPFWQAVVDAGQMPLFFDDTAVFLYRGPGQTVIWRGDFTQWDRAPAAEGIRQGESDIWLMTRQFPLDARLDYKIIVDGMYLLDPLNPRTQLGGFGPNSALHMPDYRYPAETLPRSGIAHGQLSEPFTLQSQALDYPVQYQVYTLVGYETLANLPVIYATDGQDYAHPEMGALPIVLDNLIADGEIQPVMAVFVDMRDPASGSNRRNSLLVANERFQQFLINELIPAIDQTYRTRAAADGRVILGTSLGGLHAAYTGLHHPDVFGMAAIYSPYFLAHPQALSDFATSERLPLKVFMMQGIYDFDVTNTRQLEKTLTEKGYVVKYIETSDGHSWGNWRGMMNDMLGFFFSTEK